MVRQTAAVITLELIGGLLLLVVLAIAALAFRLASGPIDLDMFKGRIETALSAAREGRAVTLDGVALEWSREDRRVNITARGLELYDDQREVAAAAERAVIVLDASSLVLGDVEVLRVRLSDGWLAAQQTAPGEWVLAGDPLPPIPARELPTTAAEWLDAANLNLPIVLQALEDQAESLSVESIEVERFSVLVKDAAGQDVLSLADATGRVARTQAGDEITLSLSGRGVGEGLPAGIALELASSDSHQSLTSEFAVAGWSLEALAKRVGLSGIALEGLPADVAIVFDVSKANGVETVQIQAQAGAGTVTVAGAARAIGAINTTLEYVAVDDRLSLDMREGAFGPVKGGFQLTVEAALKGAGPRAFELTMPRADLDFRPVFERPFVLDDVAAAGRVDFSLRQVDFDRLQFVTSGALLKASGDVGLNLTPANPALRKRESPVILNMAVEVTGPLTTKQLVTYWPVKLGWEARAFVSNRVLGGTVRNATATITLTPDSFAQGFLQDDHLSVDFAADNVGVRFMDDLPPVTRAVGTGRLTGNSFRAAISRAEYGGWDLTGGEVEFAKLNPRGNDMRVFARGRGPAVAALRNLSNSRLQLQARTGFDPERFSGDADMTFELLRPTLKGAPPELTRFTASGRVTNAGLKSAALGFDMAGATADVNVTQDAMSVTGYGRLGPAPITFSWRDGLGKNTSPAVITATGTMTPDILNRFGISGRAYLTGEVPMQVEATLVGEQVNTADISLDLNTARIDVSEIGWVKRANSPASATIRYSKSGGAQRSVVKLVSPDATIDGDFEIGPMGRILSANLRRGYLRDRADVSGQLGRLADGTITLDLTGAYLDISEAMPGFKAGETTGSFNSALTLDADVKTLKMRAGLDMKDAKMRVVSTTNGLQLFKVSGATIDGSPLQADYDASGAGGATLNVTSANAGFLVEALIGSDVLKGGAISLTGKLGRDGQPSNFDIQVKDARLRNAPFLTQILSLASLRGLADTLGGEGVLFSRIDVPLTVGGGRYIIKGGRASGPAMGLTVNGWMGIGDSAINLDGVLVPSYGLNSVLGEIPLFGDLVVGRKGEGIFSLTYSVRGTLQKAQVSVNPLSAVTPGILRRILENPADTSIPETELPKLDPESSPG